MKDLLQICRFDGKRYWIRDSEEKWMVTESKTATLIISMARQIHMGDAVKLRNELKLVSKDCEDPEWDEAVDWRKFTKGRLLITGFGTVELCDPNGDSKRSMKIADFNRILTNRFPSKRRVPENTKAHCFLLV